MPEDLLQKYIDKKIKDFIRKQRKKLNISIEELAAQMGVSSQTIRNWESKRIKPSKDTFR